LGVSLSPWGVSGPVVSCFMAAFTAGGGMSLAGVCAAGDLDSSGAAERMCCSELMFATGRAWVRRLVWGWCSSGVRRGP
jgi:hypothetical protein